MAINLESLGQYLERRGWTYALDSDQNLIATGVQSEQVDNFQIVIQLLEDGEFLNFYVPQLLTIPDSVYKSMFFQTLLSINYQQKMIKFGYDPTDGEVVASVGISLEDNTLTVQQFDRCLSSLIQSVELAMPRLKQVLVTGIDPGVPGIKDVAKALAQNLSSEEIELLRELFAVIQE
jgi:Putative bacterial sensory transduction regulator